MQQAVLTSPDTDIVTIQKIFASQKSHQYKLGNTSCEERRKKIKKLLSAIDLYSGQIKKALYQDYKKHSSEVSLTEIYPVIKEAKYILKNLCRWMQKEKVGTPIAMFGSSSYIKYEPKGVVLIISPWNFPVNLTFGPLISAIAAGNAVILKPSEYTPHTSRLMKHIILETFEENEVALIEGGITTSKVLLNLPFNHIFFTGSSTVGKRVMEAAARHLSSVTLELGGKSPTIVDRSANLNTAVRRITWAKYINNGQVCIAPDYVYVHSAIVDKFITKVKEKVQQFYSDDALLENAYARIVNKKQFDRINGYLQDAINKGAKIELGGKVSEKDNYISPTVLTNVDLSTDLMQNEIFGPIMPILTFSDLEAVVHDINQREKPLALYIYSKKKRNIDYIINHTRAGGTCINHSSVHFFNNNLPFGGSNNSGIGKSHGHFGFQAFSNARGILKQHYPNALDFLTPPYSELKNRIINITMKYF